MSRSDRKLNVSQMEDALLGNLGEHLNEHSEVDGEWLGRLSCYGCVSARRGRDSSLMEKRPCGCDGGHMVPIHVERFSPYTHTREKELISVTGDLTGHDLAALEYVLDNDIEAWVGGKEILLVYKEPDLKRDMRKKSQI